MREALATAAQTMGYILVTGVAIWMIFQHAPSP
jgi:ABC-type nickel/cobalt efflux system permease component RcnA